MRWALKAMKVKNISYPYPVLGNEDDIKGSFEVSFHHRLGRNAIQLSVKFKLQNKTLKKLIKEKKAKFTVEIECNTTFFRTMFSTFDYSNQFDLKAEKCRERVTVKFFIRAAQPIKNYQIEECHSDYKEFMKDYPIDISKGDVLAVGGVSSFIAEKGYDPLKPKVASFIAIKENPDENEDYMVVNYNDPNRIIIWLSQKDWKKYYDIKSSKWLPPVLHASIVMPVLAEAIRFIEKNESEVEGFRWYNRIMDLIERDNLSLDDPLTAAQIILKMPVNRCLESIWQQDEIQEGE